MVFKDVHQEIICLYDLNSKIYLSFNQLTRIFCKKNVPKRSFLREIRAQICFALMYEVATQQMKIQEGISLGGQSTKPDSFAQVHFYWMVWNIWDGWLASSVEKFGKGPSQSPPSPSPPLHCCRNWIATSRAGNKWQTNTLLSLEKHSCRPHLYIY